MTTLTIAPFDTSLTNAAVYVVQSAPLSTVLVTQASAVNTDVANAHSVSIYRVPYLGSVDNTNIIIDTLPIAPKTTVILSALKQQAVSGGDTFWAQSDDESGTVNLNLTLTTII